MISKIEKPDDYQPVIEPEDGEGAATHNPLTYVHGRLTLNEQHIWMFESYQHCFQEKDYPDLVTSLANLVKQTITDSQWQKDQLEEAKQHLKANAEEKRQAAIEAAKRAKAKNKKKGAAEEAPVTPDNVGGDDDEEAEEELHFDLEKPAEFEKALAHKIKMPFIFGPVEFHGLHLSEAEDPFDFEREREQVVAALQRTPLLPPQLCIHGFRVRVKQRNLKRRSSLLKHARFMRNLQVTPNLPEVVEAPKPEEGEEEED